MSKSSSSSVFPLKTYLNTQELVNCIIKVHKKDSVLTYFLLEAHEGLFFYSTLDHNEEEFRLIQIYSPIEFEEELEKLLCDLGKMFPMEVVQKSIDKDS